MGGLLRAQEPEIVQDQPPIPWAAFVPEVVSQSRKIVPVEQENEGGTVGNRRVQENALGRIHPLVNALWFLTEGGDYDFGKPVRQGCHLEAPGLPKSSLRVAILGARVAISQRSLATLPTRVKY